MNGYLPARLDDGELEKIVTAVIEETGASGPRDIGLVMKSLMPKVKGRVEGDRVKSLVQSRLSGEK